MRTFLWNLLLSWIWAAMQGEFNLGTLAVGFVLGYLILWMVTPRSRRSPYFRKAFQLLHFLAIYLWDLLLASIRVAHDVVTPHHHMRPVIIGLPLDAQTDGEITLLANLISLQPGSLALDVSEDRKTLYVHSMFGGEDVDGLRASIKQRIELRVLELMR